MRPFHAFVLGLVPLASFASVGRGQVYDCVIEQSASGLTGSLGFAADTAGTLIGDWTADANPTGTRTKPGLFGGFGSNENLPVSVGLGVALAGNLDTATAGGFTLTLDIGAGLVQIDGFDADLLAGGGASIPATISIAPDSFRTKQPDSAYIGIPLDLPVGEISIDALALAQTAPAIGALVEIEPGHYSFAAAGLAELTGSVAVLGTPTDIPPTPFPLALAGEIVVVGDTVTITSLQSVDQSDVQNPDQSIPQFPLDLPTILPPGDTAHLLMDLVLQQVSTSLVGDLSLVATGSAAACAADFDGNGAVDTRDVLAFLNAWAARDGSADADGNGVIDTRDVISFLNSWSGGC
ncbi:MAG: hypothetical protein IPJ41_06000 [Phycisphaerales bacterium]|nr:hypothetical protein [Phycisphaerales bacterium]